MSFTKLRSSRAAFTKGASGVSGGMTKKKSQTPSSGGNQMQQSTGMSTPMTDTSSARENLSAMSMGSS